MNDFITHNSILTYDHIDSIENSKYNKELKIQDFYSNLHTENISDKDLNYYLKVWNMLKENISCN